MIDTIIFDFGDIFINLDKQATIEGLERLGLSSWNEDLDRLNISFEKGQISRDDFLLGIQKQIPNAHILDQYANLNNPNAHYYGTAQEIIDDFGTDLDMFVAGVGTGESTFEILELLENETIEQKRWWHIDNHLHKEIPQTFEAQAEKFYELFRDACRIRLVSDVPVATALSGGLDSSSVYSVSRSDAVSLACSNFFQPFLRSLFLALSSAFFCKPSKKACFRFLPARNCSITASAVSLPTTATLWRLSLPISTNFKRPLLPEMTPYLAAALSTNAVSTVV
jgi:hypothetical protein